jgi:hypothetical protein
MFSLYEVEIFLNPPLFFVAFVLTHHKMAASSTRSTGHVIFWSLTRSPPLSRGPIRIILQNEVANEEQEKVACPTRSTGHVIFWSLTRSPLQSSGPIRIILENEVANEEQEKVACPTRSTGHMIFW